MPNHDLKFSFLFRGVLSGVTISLNTAQYNQEDKSFSQISEDHNSEEAGLQ